MADVSLQYFLAAAVGSAYNLKTSIAEPLPVPEDAWDRRRRQYRSASFLGVLASQAGRLGGGTHAPLLGITELDIYAAGLNFVFGQADAARGVAVISLARLANEFYGKLPNSNLLRERALKEAIHELGHVFGLSHCQVPTCIMRFSNTILDTDRKGPGFCQRCYEQLGQGMHS